MKNLYIFLVFILLFSSLDVFSKKHFNNWYFGEQAGISFNTKSGEPVKLTVGIMDAPEACSAISDSLGNLLFYTNGVTVWDRLHNTMNNGYYLNDSDFPSTTLIVPLPGSNCQYYIFNENDGNSYYNNRKRSKFNYSIVDLSLGNGFGEVTKKNILLSDSLAYTLAANGHKNGTDVWIVTVDQVNKKFLSYLLTKDSLVSTPIYSPINKKFDLNLISKYWQSDSKFSPDGKKLALVCSSDSNVYLYDFNNQTGEITNEIMFSISNRSPFSLEFSNNSKLLYLISRTFLSNTPIVYLNQYDISSNDPVEISNSVYHIFETRKYREFLYALQMGPNNKIYTLSDTTLQSGTTISRLMVINNPDLLGNDCDFKFSENNSFYGHGHCLPKVVQNYNPKKEHCIYHNITVCEGSNLFLYSPDYFDVNYKWFGPQ
jgi:hypothetical protein